MEKYIANFAKIVASSKIEIYNEFSLQHELGIFLRNNLSNEKVQFERNVSYFGLNKSNFVKREMDIAVFKNPIHDRTMAIELKYPRNGQYPEQMYNFCKDIAFAEQLKLAGFQNAFVVIFADDRLFYDGRKTGIYSFFRGGSDLTGDVPKPTGSKAEKIHIKGNYSIVWHPVKSTLKYSIIRAQ